MPRTSAPCCEWIYSTVPGNNSRSLNERYLDDIRYSPHCGEWQGYLYAHPLPAAVRRTSRRTRMLSAAGQSLN